MNIVRSLIPKSTLLNFNDLVRLVKDVSFSITSGIAVTSQNAADISIYFDVGGIIGGILAGLAADFTGMSASVCSIMLIIAVPTVSLTKIRYWKLHFDA